MSQRIHYQIGNTLYLNLNDRCTLVCDFCPKTQGTLEYHGYDLSLEHRPEIDEIIAALPQHLADFDEVVFCGYGEPTLRLKTLLAVAKYIKEQGGKTRINTDGLANLVHKRNVLPEMQGYIDALSISLNAQDEETYNRHCAPQLPGAYAAMREFLRLSPQYIPDVRASAIEGLDGVDIDACRTITEESGAHFTHRKLDVL